MSRTLDTTAANHTPSGPRLKDAVLAGSVYFAAIFAIGFVFGVLRTLALDALPNLTRLGAVLVEIPVILALAWMICGVVMARFSLSAREGAAIVMGVIALVLLLGAEAGLSIGMNGLSLQQHLALYHQPSHVTGLAGQCLFALFPWFRVRLLPPPARHLQTKP